MYNRIGKMSPADLQAIADRVNSIAGLIRELGYKKDAGGTYSVVKKYLKLHEINTSHWKGQAWSKDQQLKDWTNYSRHQSMKRHLLRERTHRCEYCNLELWNKSPIPLEVHHVDGDRTNNDPTNLKLLCPNCHAITDNWKGRKK